VYLRITNTDAPTEGLIYGTRETSVLRMEGYSVIQSVYHMMPIETWINEQFK